MKTLVKIIASIVILSIVLTFFAPGGMIPLLFGLVIGGFMINALWE